MNANCVFPKAPLRQTLSIAPKQLHAKGSVE